MDGLYLNRKNEFIKNWLKKTVSDAKWENFPDLHVDEIDSEFKNKETWIETALYTFNYLNNLLGVRPFDLLLIIPLIYKNQPAVSGFRDFDSLTKELYITPPSIYLVPRQNGSFNKTIKDTEYLSDLSREIGANVYYKEEKEDDEFCRTIFVARNTMPQNNSN